MRVPRLSGIIDPKTGKRRNWVDPNAAAKEHERQVRDLESQIATFERTRKIALARDHLLDFTQFTMPDPEAPNDVSRSRYKAAKFHIEIAKVLEQVERGDITQLIFCMPPRHGKSALATKSMTAWYMGRHPDHQIAVATYSDAVANDFGSDTRAIVLSQAYKQVFPTMKLRRGGTAKDNMETVFGGRTVFVGRGGALTGKGAHCLLIDDLYKDHEEARSPAIREQAWNWFTKVAMTRRMGKKLVVVTMTRWHSDDIIGRLTDPENPCYNEIEAKRWKIIRLPAIAEDDDPLGRAPGEPLWPDGPDKFDLDFLHSQQRLDPLGFAALYQQRPTVADGILFRRETIQRYDRKDLPEDLRYYAASDHAVGTAQRNDPSCFIKVGVDRQDNIYVLDCVWKRMPTDVAVEAMLTMASGETRPLVWWAERGHISKSIGPFLMKRAAESGIYINVREMTPANDKAQRAQSIAARCAMGKVYFPKEMWADRAIEEMLAFPNGTHDDFVDALAYIGLGLQSMFGAKTSQRPVQSSPKFGTLAWVKEHDRFAEERKRAASRGGF